MCGNVGVGVCEDEGGGEDPRRNEREMGGSKVKNLSNFTALAQ